MNINFQKLKKFYKLYQNSSNNFYVEKVALKTSFLNHDYVNKILEFSLKVDQNLCNLQGGMYGGALSTLLDYTTSFNLIIHDEQLRNSVSLNLNTNFIRPALQNDNIKIYSKTIQIGKAIGLAEFEVQNESGKILCRGSHQAYMKGPYKIEGVSAKIILENLNQLNNIEL